MKGNWEYSRKSFRGSGTSPRPRVHVFLAPLAVPTHPITSSSSSTAGALLSRSWQHLGGLWVPVHTVPSPATLPPPGSSLCLTLQPWGLLKLLSLPDHLSLPRALLSSDEPVLRKLRASMKKERRPWPVWLILCTKGLPVRFLVMVHARVMGLDPW